VCSSSTAMTRLSLMNSGRVPQIVITFSRFSGMVS